MMRLDRLRWLSERSQPHFGQLTLWILLACSASLGGYFLTHRALPPQNAVRTGPATILSFLPEWILWDQSVFAGCGVLFVVAGGLWAGRLLIPWSGWLTAGAFTAILALYHETASQATHVAHLANMLLFIHALWYHLCRGEIRTALAQDRFWNSPVYPRWVYALSVFYIGLFYGLSGLGKLLTSGLAWPNGVSLQLWASLWGDPDSFWTRLILSNRTFARGLQICTLVGETSGFLAIVSPRLRPLVGFALVGFHYGAICVFSWGFHANMVLVALFFLPFFTWIPRLVDWWERSKKGVRDQGSGVRNQPCNGVTSNL
jgi:hypothetical protein